MPPSIDAYLQAVVAACAPPAGPLVSLVLFGSGNAGGYQATLSDVDLLVVLRDDVDHEENVRIRTIVGQLEQAHGLAKPARGGTSTRALVAFADRMTANVRAFFVCTRADLLSGAPGRILDLPSWQAAFVDGIAVPSIVGSGRTVWGEELLGRVPCPPIRRMDVAKAFVGLFPQALFSVACYPLLPDATRYAMDTLKRSVHSCYFCHEGRPAPLADEVAYLGARYGPDPVLDRLLALRRAFRPSLAFVLRCLPTIMRMHWRTARELAFPRVPR